MVSVKKIKAKDTYFVRKEVLRKGTNLPVDFEGDLNESTFHLGVYKDEKLISIGTFIKNNYKELTGEHYQLRGMATIEEERGNGYGKVLLDVATKELEKMKIDFLWCNAREYASKFYINNSFKIKGNQFMVNGIGFHYKMFKSIKNECN